MADQFQITVYGPQLTRLGRYVARCLVCGLSRETCRGGTRLQELMRLHQEHCIPPYQAPPTCGRKDCYDCAIPAPAGWGGP